MRQRVGVTNKLSVAAVINSSTRFLAPNPVITRTAPQMAQ